MEALPGPSLLHAFAVFAEHLNFTHAAAALGVSQPALHGQVGRLSELLGVSLYQRRGRALVLTAAGVAVCAHAREVVEHGEAFVQRLRGQPDRAPVVLAAGQGSLLYLLGPAVRGHLGAGWPAPRLLVRGPAAICEGVRSGEAHVGVLPDAPEGLEGEPLAEVGQQLVMPADHPLAAREAVRPADLVDARLVVPPRPRPQRLAIDAALAEVPWSVAVEVSGWPLAMHCAGLGLGLAVVNDYCRPPAGLVARPMPGLPRIMLWAVRRAGARPSAAAEDLWSRLVG